MGEGFAMDEGFEHTAGGPSRRDVLRRGAIVAGALAWTTPAVQAIDMSRAFAQDGSGIPAPTCNSGVVVATSTNVQQIGQTSLVKDATESDSLIRLMLEKQDVTGTAVAVNTTVPGTWVQGSALPGGTVPASAIVTSWMLHMDVVANSGTTNVVIEATITFARPILGLIMRTPELNASDVYLGFGTANYWRQTDRQTLELNDQVTWSGNTLSVRFQANGTGLDNLRVVTQGCPDE